MTNKSISLLTPSSPDHDFNLDSKTTCHDFNLDSKTTCHDFKPVTKTTCHDFKPVSKTTCHDLGLDAILTAVTGNENEQKIIMNIMALMTPDPQISQFRCDVFDDFYRYPELRKRLTELFNKIRFLHAYSSFKKEIGATPGLWDLLHRMYELNDFIVCTEAIMECLTEIPVQSKGLIGLREYVKGLYEDGHFAAMKKDIAAAKISASQIASITIGLNLNKRFEVVSAGLISVNDRFFESSGIVSQFAHAVNTKDPLHKGANWDQDFHFNAFTDKDANGLASITGAGGRMRPSTAADTVATMPENDSVRGVTQVMDREVSKMMTRLVKQLREVLSQYARVGIRNMSSLIPELLYYTLWAEYIEGLTAQGLSFCRPVVMEDDYSSCRMSAKGIYNLKLVPVVTEEHREIVTNDLVFDDDRTVYILTGANRGGKTTITQAIGLLYMMAQGGIYVPGDHFAFVPVDCIYTLFPADEDQTLDLGRLGEECTRFRKIYDEITGQSLILLNETFSTTSFEEGLYIARDTVRAVLQKGSRMIFTTHMHKLASELCELNSFAIKGKAASLLVRDNQGKGSFHIEEAAPEGMSYAKNIAEKYGVTYEMLIGMELKRS